MGTSEDLFASLPRDPLASGGVEMRPSASGSPVEDVLDSLGIQRMEPAIKGVYDSVSKDDPDRSAKVMELSRRMNQPMSFVDKNLPMIEPVANAPDADYWKDFEKNNPGATKFLMNPQNMVAAHDDADNIGFFEGIVTDAKEGWRRGQMQVDIAVASRTQRERGDESLEPFIQAKEKELAGIEDRGGFVRRAAEQLPNMIFSYKSGLKRGGQGALALGGAAAVVGQLGPQVATPEEIVTVPVAAGIGFKIGMPIGLFEAAKTLEGELAYREFINYRDEDGKPLPREIAAKYADIVGVINGTIEGGADVVQTALLGIPVFKAAGGAALKMVSKVPGASRIVGMIESNPGTFSKMTLGAAIRKAAIKIAASEASEISTEVVQEGVSGGLGEAARRSSGQPFEKTSPGDIAKRSMGVIGPTFQATLLPALLGGGAGVYNDVVSIRKSAQAKQVYEAMGATAEASKLRARLPEAHKAYVESITQGTPVENVHIPADAFETYFQSKDIDPDAAAGELGVRESLDHARESGGDVEIPLAVWTDKMVGTEHYKAFADDIKFHPDDLTQRQIRDMTESTAKALEGEADKAVAEDKDLLPGKEAVYADIKGQLMDAGRPEPEAKAAAQLWANRAVVEAKRRGITPEEWYGSRLRVTSEAAPTAIKISRADIEKRAAELHAQASQEFRSANETAQRWKELIGPGFRSPNVTAGGRDVMGEYNRLPLWMKNNEGRPMDEVPEEARAQGLLTDKEDFFSKMERFRSPVDPGKPTDYFEEARRSLQGERRLSQDPIPWNQGPVRSEFLGYQEPFSDFPAMPLFNIYGEHPKAGSTVGEKTLRQLGVQVPEIPGYEEWLAKRGNSIKEQGRRNVPEQSQVYRQERPLSEGSPQAENIPQDSPEAPRDPLGSAETGTPNNGQEGPRVHVPFEGQRSVFADGVPWDISITRKPGFDKWSADADAVVRKAAAAAGAEPTPEFIDKYWRGIHDEMHDVQIGTVEERAAKAKALKEKYPDELDALNVMRLLSRMDQLRMMLNSGDAKNASVLMDSVLKRYDDIARPKAGIEAEKGGQTLFQKPIQTDTSEFKRWFGDSKVVDKNGQPLVVYHGTGARIDEFKPEMTGKGNDQFGSGFYFTTSKDQAKRYESATLPFSGKPKLGGTENPNTLETFLSIKNPIKLSPEQENLKDVEIPFLQAKKIIAMAPGILDPKKSPLVNWIDKGGKKFTPSDVAQVAKEYNNLITIENDFFSEHPTEFRKALADVTGHDGVVKTFKDGSKHFVAWFPEQIKSATGNRGTFDPKNPNILMQDPADPRGFIRFTPKETIIALTKADASTFMHESAHFWLKDMHDFVRSDRADEKYLKDWKPLAKWLGVKEEQTELTVDQQEKFAKGFEVYLREGKSPSLELKSAFRLFRRWLTKLYRSLPGAGLDVGMSDEVRGVMDRMVASEDEIDAARRALGYDAPMAEGLSAADQAKMAALREESRQQAIESLIGAQAKELSPEHKAFLARELARAEHAATEQSEGLMAYRAIYDIGRMFKDKDNPTPDGRAIAADYLNSKLDENARTTFDLLADRNGFGSGQEMADAVVSARDIKEEIAARVETWMSQYKDLRLLDSSFREEAMRSAHNASQMEFSAMEHSILADKAEAARAEKGPGAGRTWKPMAARLEAKVVAERAKEIIAKRPVRRAGDYVRYFTQEKNAAAESARAAAAGDFEKAADFKRKQLFNHALAMESLKAKAEIDTIGRYLKKFADRDQDMKDMPYGFISQVDRLLSDHKVIEPRDWDRSLAKVAKDMRDAGDPWDVIANHTGLLWDGGQMRWRPETLPEMVKRIQDNYYDIAIPEGILNGRPGDYKWMSLADYRDLRTAVQVISNIGRGYERFVSHFIKADIKEASLAIRSSIEANVGVPYAARRAIGHPDSAFLEKWDKWTTQPGDKALDLVNLLTLSRYLDGGKDTGPMQEFVYRTLTTSENDKFRMTREMTDSVNKLLSDHFTKEEFKRLRTEKVKFDFLPKGRQNLTREEMIAVALNTGNDGNLDRLLSGLGLDGQGVMTIVNSLTKKEMDFVQATWDHLETYWPKVMDLQMQVSGSQPEKVVAREVQTVHGRYRGGYYPIAYDYTKSAEAYKHAEQLNELYKQYGSASAFTRHGHTKLRVDHLNRPLNLSLNVFFRHLENVVHDLAFRGAVIDVNRLLREKHVREAIANALGSTGMRTIEGSLKAVASDQGEFLDNFEKAVRWVRFGATLSRLGWRPVKMPGDIAVNLLLGVQEIGATRLRRAMTNFVMNPKETVAFVNEKSERMTNRAAVRDRDLKDLHAKWKGKSTAKDVFFLAMSISDQALTYPMWKEVYSHNLLTHGDELARHIADETVTRTFGSGSVIDQAGISRGNEYKKSLTWWYSWQGMMFNRAWLQGRIAGLQYDKGNYGKAAMTVATSAVMLWILPGMIEGAFAQLFRNSPDREDDKWKKRLASRVIQQGFGYVPVLRDAVGYYVDKSMGLHSTMQLPLESTITAYINPLAELSSSWFTGDELPERWWEHAASAGLLAAGIPQQVGMMAFNFIDWMRDKGELTWRDMLTRKVKR